MKLIKILLTFLIFGILIGGFFHKINAITQDLGRHLLTGEIIVKTQNIPKTNLFSYTYPNFPFINHHWLSEVIYYFIYSLSGFNGLLIFSTLMVVAAFSLIFFYSLKQYNNAAILTIASLLYFGVLFERTDLRPEIFSFLFLSIFIVILYSYRQNFTKWIFILPLIELLWVNAHIYFPIGIVILVLFLIDSFITHRNNLYCRYIGILVIISTVSVFATFLNPNGLNGALYPFKVFRNYGYTIEENQNIFFLWQLFQKPTIVFFAVSILLLFTTLFTTIKKTRLIDWLLAVFFTIFAMFAIRNFPLFVFATFIPLVKSFSNSERLLCLRQLADPRNNKENGSRIKSGMTIIFILFSIIIFWQIMQITKTKTFGFGVEKGASNATDFFIKNNLKGPIFNNFDIGSYLEYRLYPKEKVFVDGRPEAYPDNFFKETYMLMQDNKDVFEKISLNYKFNTIFFAHSDQTSWATNFLRQITNNNNWKMIYLDDYVVIFVKDNQENQKLIKNFFITQNSFKINSYLNNNLYALFRLASFFQKTGWVEKEVEAYQKMLSINPNFCPALYNLSLALNQKQDPTYTIFLQKFQVRCK